MYYIYSDITYPGAIGRLIQQLLKLDRNEDTPFSETKEYDCESSLNQQPKKHRKFSACVLKVTPETLCKTLCVKFTNTKNSTDINQKLYETFRQQLIVVGIIQWRQHNRFQDRIILSDYCAATGGLKSLSYVHVTSTLTHDVNYFVQCTCQIYNTIKCAGLSEIELLDVVLDECWTCMHCRFYKDHLHDYREKLHNITSSTSIGNNIKASLDTLNNPIVVVGTPTLTGTTKLSIMAGENISMVHVNFHQGQYSYANCQNGECSSRLMNKKKIPKEVDIQHNDGLCLHIQTLFANFKILEKLFPDYFASHASTCKHIECTDNDFTSANTISFNTDDEYIDDSSNGTMKYFNTLTGLWGF